MVLCELFVLIYIYTFPFHAELTYIKAEYQILIRLLLLQLDYYQISASVSA